MAKNASIFIMLLLATDVAYATNGKLLDIMAKLQYFTHKLYLSMESGNKELANFYTHEIDELILKLERVPDFQGYPVRFLSKQHLRPAFNRFRETVVDNDSDWLDEYGAVLDACNQCHSDVGHGFINIEINKVNVYMQKFD